MLLVEQIAPQEPDWMREMPVFDDVPPQNEDEVHVPEWVKGEKPQNSTESEPKIVCVTVPSDKYLSDLELDLPNRVQIYANTGVGKSYWALETFEYLTFAAPTQDLVNQLADDARKRGKHVDRKYQHANEVTPLSKRVACTFNSLRCTTVVTGVEGRTLVIDESHCISTDGGYRRKVMDDVQDIMARGWERVICITSTPRYQSNSLFEQFNVVKVKSDIRQQLYQYVDSETMRLDALRKRLDVKKQSLIFLNDTKDKLDKTVAMCHALGLSDDEILIYNAKTKRDKMQRDMVMSQIVPDRVRVVISTSVVILGLSFKSNFDCIHVVSNLHPSDEHQLANRPRLNSAKVLIYGVGDGEHGHEWEPTALGENHRETAETLLKLIEVKLTRGGASDIESVRKIVMDNSSLIRKTKDMDGKTVYKVSYAGIDACVARAENAYYAGNKEAHSQYLKKYGWVCVGSVEASQVAGTAERVEVEKMKEQREKEHAKRCKAMAEIDYHDAMTIARRGSKKHKRDVVDAVREVVGDLRRGYIDYEVARDLYADFPSKRARNRLIRRIVLSQMVADGDSRMCAIVDGFPIGSKFTSDELRDKYIEIIKGVDKEVGEFLAVGSRATKNNVARLINDIFKTKRVRADDKTNCVEILGMLDIPQKYLPERAPSPPEPRRITFGVDKACQYERKDK